MKPHEKGLIALALTAGLAPFFLGRRRRLHRRMFIAAPPELIFPYLNDLRNWPRWRSWHWQKDGPHFSYAGPPSGVGATQIFEMRSGDGALRLTVSEPPDHLAYTIELADDSAPIEGVISLRQVRRGTWVRWLLKWEGQASPPLRYLDLWHSIRRVRRMGRDLANLRQLAESGLSEAERADR